MMSRVSCVGSVSSSKNLSRQEISAYTKHDDPNGLTVNEMVIAFVLAHVPSQLWT
jgi:hypothetical protein